MTNPLWGPALWVPTPWPEFPSQPPPEEPPPEQAGIRYNPWVPAVYQAADWTCSCASSAWVLNSLGDDRLGRNWDEWDVVATLREATYPAAVSPNYGLARADMADLETMYRTLGYTAARKQRITRDDLIGAAGTYPMQINGARFYHHVGARAIGNGVLILANPAPNWRGVGQELTPAEAALWGSWNSLWITGRIN